MFLLPSSNGVELSSFTVAALRTVTKAPELCEVFWCLETENGEIVQVDAAGRGRFPGGSFSTPDVIHLAGLGYIYADNGKHAGLTTNGRTMESLAGQFSMEESPSRVAGLISETLIKAGFATV